jgi:hypothetical protein
MAHIIAGRPWVASDNEEMVRNEFIPKVYAFGLKESNSALRGF